MEETTPVLRLQEIQKRRSRDDDVATIKFGKRGSVYFNGAFIETNGLQNAKFCKVYLDQNARVVGFRFFEEKREDRYVVSATKSRIDGLQKSKSLRSQSFLKGFLTSEELGYYDYKKVQGKDVGLGDKDEVYVVNLKADKLE